MNARLIQRLLLVCLVCSAWGVGRSVECVELEVSSTLFGRRLLQAGSNCVPGSDRPNACFNADGSRFICCGPESCPSVPGSEPQCAGTSTGPNQGCDAQSGTPNPCYDADGTGFTCCPGACSPVNTPVAFCAFDEETPSDDNLVDVFFIIAVENYTLADLTQELQDAYLAAFQGLPDVVEVEILEVTEGSLHFRTRLRIFSRALKAVIQGAKKIVEPVFRVATSIIVSVFDLIDPGIPPSPICADDCPYRNNAGQLVCKGDCVGASDVCPTYPTDITNGCGPAGSGLTFAVFDWFANVPRYLSLALDAFQNACNHHDVCYGTPGRSQFDCDRELQLRLQGGCAVTYPILLTPDLRINCLAWAYVTSTFVRVFGTPAHTEGQKATEAFADANCTTGGGE